VVLTNDRKTYLSLRYLRNQGRLGSGSFIHPYLGMNFRMTDLQCAVGVAQLRKFEEIKRAKLRNYALYQSLLEGVAEATFVEVSDDSNFVPFRVNVRVKKLRGLMKFLEQHSIQTRGFFYPLHRQPCFKYLGYRREAFPNSNALYDSGLSLPIFPAITERQIRYICRKIRQFYGYR
jgi:perosamine synthetase